MPRLAWGKLVAASMAAPLSGWACGPAPEPASPSGPGPSALVAAPGPPAERPFAPRVLPASRAIEPVLADLAGVLMASGGAFEVAYVDAEPARCAALFPGGTGCKFIRMRQGEGGWGPPLPVGQTWASLSDGRGVVYASRQDRPLAIDAIDADGKVTPLYDAPAGKQKELREVKVVPAANGFFVFGQELASEADAYLVRSPLSMVVLEQRSGGLVEARRARLPMAMVGGTARDARQVRGSKVGYGSWQVAPSLDEASAVGSLVAMAWMEVTPPPKAPSPWEQARREQQKGKHACRAVGRSVMMGCAGSRSLENDPSIKRRRRLTVFTPQGTVKRDLVVDADPRVDGQGPVRGVQAVPGGWVVDGLSVGSDLKIKGPAPAAPPAASAPLPLKQRVPERPLLSAWDEVAGEGVVGIALDRALVDDSAGTSLFRRFDAEGHWVGEPQALAALAASGAANVAAASRLIHAQDGWYFPSYMGICQLSGGQGCKHLVEGADSVGKCRAQAERMVFPSPGDTRTTFFTLACDRELTAGQLDADELRFTSVKKLSGEAEPVAAGRAADGRAWALVFDKGKPARLTPEDPAAEGLTLGSEHATLHRVGKGLVVREHGPGARLIWVGSGVSAPAPEAPAGQPVSPGQGAAADPAPEPLQAGALLPGGRLMLGERPGEVKELPEEIASIAARCIGAYLVAPGRLLLLCAEAAHDVASGAGPVAVTLRRVEF